MNDWTDWMTIAALAEATGLKRNYIEAYAARGTLNNVRKGYVFERRRATPEDISALGCPPHTQWLARAMKVEPHKRCRRCGEHKPLTNYNPAATAKDGHASICKGCDGRRLGRTSVMTAKKSQGCHTCGGALTRNRTIKLDGRLLCHPCWQQVWA